MAKRLIFISCGQQTKVEKNLGSEIKNLVDQTPGFEGYFADTVNSLEALSVNIFEAIRKCDGAIFFFHERGKVVDSSGEIWGVRSSVWVNQEIALLAYRKYLEQTGIPIIAFKDGSVLLEGAMTNLIVNPHLISSKEEIESKISKWLLEAKFPNKDIDMNKPGFEKKWGRLSENARYVLMALVDEGGKDVAEHLVRQGFKTYQRFPSEQEGNGAFTLAKAELFNVGFIKKEEAFRIMNIHENWQLMIKEAVVSLKEQIELEKLLLK